MPIQNIIAGGERPARRRHRFAATAKTFVPKARCCRDTVYEAILGLEAMGVFSNDSGLMDIDRRISNRCACWIAAA